MTRYSRNDFIYIYTSLPETTVFNFYQAHGDLTIAEASFGSSTTHLRQHVDTTKRNGDLEKHEARKAGSKGDDSRGSSSEKDAGASLTK